MKTKRNRRLRPKNKVIIIVCEGKTEEKYFEKFSSRMIRLHIKRTKERDPFHLLKQAQKYEEEMGASSEAGDAIWLVFDMDDEERVGKAVKEAKTKYKIGLSIPTFELWILLHYRMWDIKGSSKSDIEKELKTYIKNYRHGIDVYEQIQDRTKIAINNARKLKEMKTDLSEEELYTSKANPITHVYKLVEFLEENKDR